MCLIWIVQQTWIMCRSMHRECSSSVVLWSWGNYMDSGHSVEWIVSNRVLWSWLFFSARLSRPSHQHLFLWSPVHGWPFLFHSFRQWIAFPLNHHSLVPENFLQGFSPDASLLLFATEVQNIWRHSFTARYFPYLWEMPAKLFKNRNFAGIWSLTLWRTAPRRFWEKERWPSFTES